MLPPIRIEQENILGPNILRIKNVTLNNKEESEPPSRIKH